MSQPRFFASENLMSQTMTPGEPWNFKSGFTPSEQIRHDKESRQQWYHTADTKWNFYTAFEGFNPNQRISKKDNPPRFANGVVADFDVKVPRVRILEVVEAMKIKPAWIEKSLGDGARLVWEFPEQVRMDSFDFAIHFLTKAQEWLGITLLPGPDLPAFLSPGKLYCNGADWTSTGYGPINAIALQAFFVATARDFRFKSNDPAEVPLDVVEKKCKETYPGFSWPSDFTLDSQGPSFWVPGSTSPMSAIVKKDGMVSLAAHADRTFYSWSEICGKDFVKDYADGAVSKATSGIYYDKKHYWRRFSEGWDSMTATDMQIYLDTDCGLSTKPDKTGKIPVRAALSHIHNHNRILGGAPFIFQPSGPIMYQGNRVLNTYQCKAIRPAADPAIWGPNGNLPWCSLLFDNLFDPVLQREFFLAWAKHRYMSAIQQVPRASAHIFLVGHPGMGKTLTSRGIMGKLLGGFVDASRMLLENLTFTSEFYEVPLWCVDDDTSNDNPHMQARAQTMWKKTSANQEFFYHKKFEVPLTILYPAAMIGTLNPDIASTRIVGPMDNASTDKTHLFRCAPEERKLKLPAREILEPLIEKELPYLGRFLIDYNPPELPDGGNEHVFDGDRVVHIARNDRYGYTTYHEPTLFNRARQSSKASPFKSLLIECLRFYFNREPSATEWRGAIPKLIRELQANPGNESVLRLLRLEQTERYLELIQREGLLKCHAENAEMNTREWVFPRFADMPLPAPQPEIPPQGKI